MRESICEVCGAHISQEGPGRLKKCCSDTCWKAYKRRYDKEYRTDNAQHRASYSQAQHRYAKYGVDEDRFNRLLLEQHNRCAICGVTFVPGETRITIDHDHACCPGVGSCGDCVRGLLCNSCNGGLGLFKDNPATLKAAVAYLEGT